MPLSLSASTGGRCECKSSPFDQNSQRESVLVPNSSGCVSNTSKEFPLQVVARQKVWCCSKLKNLSGVRLNFPVRDWMHSVWETSYLEVGVACEISKIEGEHGKCLMGFRACFPQTNLSFSPQNTYVPNYDWFECLKGIGVLTQIM